MSGRAWATIIVVVLILIAGSFAFLRSSGSPRPTTYADIGTELGSGRIEQPAAGFAITTPPGWLAWQPSTDWQDWWGAGTVVHLWMEPAGDAEAWWMGTCDIGEACTRERMVEAGGEAYCWVVDDPDLATEAEWTSTAHSAAATASVLAEQEGWTGISTALEELSSGEASVVRAIDPNGWSQEIWHVSDGDRWYRLICGLLDSDVEPRTIAASLEFLPTS